MLKKGTVLGLVVSAFFLLGSASAANAADWHRDCDRKIAHEQHDLDRAIARHGYYSRQADHERRELDRLYARCRDGYR